MFPKWKTFGTMQHENKAGGAFLFILAVIRCTANCVSSTRAHTHAPTLHYIWQRFLSPLPPPLQIPHFNCLFPSRFIFIFNYLSVKLAAPPGSSSGNDAVCRHCGPLASSRAHPSSSSARVTPSSHVPSPSSCCNHVKKGGRNMKY